MWDGKRRYDSIKLINIVTNDELVLFDNPVDTGYVLESLDFGSASADTSYISNVSQLGYDKLNTVFAAREVTITGWVYVPAVYDKSQYQSDYEYLRHLRMSRLNKLVNPLHDLRIEMYEYYMEMTPSTSVQYGKEYATENNEVMCKFMIAGTMAIPFFRLIERVPLNQSVRDAVPISRVAGEGELASAVLPFPGNVPEAGQRTDGLGGIFGAVDSSKVGKINNYGDVPAGFILEISSLSEIVNPTLFVYGGSKVSSSQSYKLKFLLSVEVGQTLVVNTEYGNESAYLVDDTSGDLLIENALLYMTVDSELPVFAVGMNEVELFEDEDGVIEPIYSISFTPMFLEIW